MTTKTTHRATALSSHPQLQDETLLVFFDSPKFDRLLDDVLGESRAEDQHEVEERFEVE